MTIDEYLIKNGMTCRELAELAGISTTTINKYRQNITKGFKPAVYKRLTELGLDVDLMESKKSDGTDPIRIFKRDMKSLIKTTEGGASNLITMYYEWQYKFVEELCIEKNIGFYAYKKNDVFYLRYDKNEKYLD